MLGVVISADMDLLGRLRPGNKVRFVSVDMETALEARAEQNARLESVSTVLGD
jgi:allophanate hydrolase subunit 2